VPTPLLPRRASWAAAKAAAADAPDASKKPGWISKVTRTFENDAEFDEILRLGREERRSDVLNDE
jgi:hypothetical protein